MIFSVGGEAVSAGLRRWTGKKAGRAVILAFVPACLVWIYVLLNGQNPFSGTGLLLPGLCAMLPLAFLSYGEKKEVCASDFIVFVFIAGPFFLLKMPFNSNLPYPHGNVAELSRCALVIAAVYAYVSLRELDHVGFRLEFSRNKILVSLGCWCATIVIIYLFGTADGRIVHTGYRDPSFIGFADGMRRFFKMLIHVALFEELFFRGIFQNMVTQKVKTFRRLGPLWLWGCIFLSAAAFVAGLTLHSSMRCFPALMTLVVFGVSFFIEKYRPAARGDFLVLALISSVFGIAHLHTGSAVFVGMAVLAGWFYGLTYTITKNVFYAALVHALVNCSAMFLGLTLNMK